MRRIPPFFIFFDVSITVLSALCFKVTFYTETSSETLLTCLSHGVVDVRKAVSFLFVDVMNAVSFSFVVVMNAIFFSFVVVINAVSFSFVVVINAVSFLFVDVMNAVSFLYVSLINYSMLHFKVTHHFECQKK